MKLFFVFIVIFALTEISFADELSISISSNNPKGVSTLLSRLFQDRRITKYKEPIVEDGSMEQFTEGVVKDKNGNIIECWICKEVMNALSGLINRGSTAADIARALDQVCNLLPSNWRSGCYDLVNKYTKMIINYLIHGAATGEICRLLALCSPHELLSNDGPIKYIEECRLCERMTSNARKLSMNNKANLHNEMCKETLMGSRQQCKSLVTRVNKNIEEAFVKAIQKQFCLPVYKCNVPTMVVKDKNGNIIECWICKEVMNALSGLINTGSTAADIARALGQVCNLLPSQWRGGCNDLINKYAQMIINYLIHGAATGEICHLLALCSPHEISWNDFPFNGPKKNIL